MDYWTSNQRLLLAIYHRYSLYTGLTSYLYDQRTHTFSKTRCTRALALLLNAITVGMLPFWLWRAIDLQDILRVNSLMQMVNQANICACTAVVFYIVVTRMSRESQMVRDGTELQKVEAAYFLHLTIDPVIERRLQWRFYMKYALMSYNMISSLVYCASLPRARHWRLQVLRWFGWNALNMVHLTTFTYFLIVWYICRKFCYINRQLGELIALLRKPSRSERARIRLERSCRQQLQQMLQVHWQLGDMILRLNYTFRFQTLLTRCISMSSTIVYTYTGSILNARNSGISSPFDSLTYVALFLDNYLMDAMCDMTMEEHKATSGILRGFLDLKNIGRDLQKVLTQFALQMNSRQLDIKISGLFVVNKRLWFGMWKGILSFTLVLVQFHIVLTKKENNKK